MRRRSFLKTLAVLAAIPFLPLRLAGRGVVRGWDYARKVYDPKDVVITIAGKTLDPSGYLTVDGLYQHDVVARKFFGEEDDKPNTT